MNEPRPVQLGDVDLHEAVQQVRETPDLWHVYRPEWLIVHTEEFQAGTCTSTHDPETSPPCDGSHWPDWAAAAQWLIDNTEGRVRIEDRAIERLGAEHPVHVQLRLPNLKGEFKHRAGAERYVAEQGWDDAVIVARSSRDEQKLLEYGKRKLVS